MTKITLPAERQVGHLKVLRKQRDISFSEFASLTAKEQLEIIRAADGKKKFDLLLNSQNAERLVPQLHPQELYLTINELGSADSVELLELASSEQITLLLDLDCWDGDKVSDVLSLRWLELLANAGEEKLCQLAREIEPETFALFLKKHLTIVRGLEAYDDDDAENSRRLESLYDIHYHSEDAAKIIGALLNLWQEKEQETYLLLMEMIRSENLSVLEEESFNSRNNRLLDLGIIPHHEAKSIYTYVDPDTFKPGGKIDYRLEAEELHSPLALLAKAEPNNLLADILGAGIDHETACELLHLVNRKLSADRADIAEQKEISGKLREVYDILNLALEFLSGNDVARGDEIFKTTYLLHLYQLGHSLLEQRQARARRFLTGPLYQYADFPELLFIDSLLEKPALFYRAPHGDHPSDLQPVNSSKTLALVDKRLDQIDALVNLFSGQLPFTLAEIEQQSQLESVTLAGLFMTAVANRVLGRDFVPMPLAAKDLDLLHKLTASQPETFHSFATECLALLNSLSDHCEFFGVYALELWEDFFTGFEDQGDIRQSECFLLLE